MARPAPRVSVVIPTYKRPELLTRCLDALVRQTLPPSCYEIIVVDDGSDADTRAACADVARRSASAASPWRSQSRSGIVSSSVKATTLPAAARQPRLRAAAGPRVPSGRR